MTAPGYCSPGVLQCPIQALVGEEKSLVDMVLNPTFFDALVERVLAFNVPFIDRMFEAAGRRIDFFRIGDDFGTAWVSFSEAFLCLQRDRSSIMDDAAVLVKSLG